MLELDYIECVILLPEKLFYNTGAPGAILILNKNKPKNRKEKILFINASEQYDQHPDVRKLNIINDQQIKKIAETYKSFRELDGFSRAVPIDEIKEENDYNLNVTLYVFPQEEIEEIDIEKEWKDLKNLENEINVIENKIEGYLKELK
jgi:type I restriction enzyme M protein